MSNLSPIEKMKQAVARAQQLVLDGALFTVEDAALLTKSIAWFSSYRDQSIRFEALRGMSHKELAAIWELSEARISQIVNRGSDADPVDTDFPVHEITRTNPEKPLHDFRCMWSIGDPESGYEFTHKHPGNEAVATGAVEGWTPEQLAKHLNGMENLRKPFMATGLVSAVDPDEDDEVVSVKRIKPVKDSRASSVPLPEPGARLTKTTAIMTAKEVGPKFKELRLRAGLNQTQAGSLIEQTANYVSCLERGIPPSRQLQSGMRTSLQTFEEQLKTLNYI